MNLIEEIISFEEVKSFYKTILNKMIKVNEYMYFALMYSNHYISGDPIQDIRDLNENFSSELDHLFKIKVSNSYLNFTGANTLDANINEEDIKNGLISIVHGNDANVTEVYDMYVFPYSRTKFINMFNNVSPTILNSFINNLEDCGNLIFKKSYIIAWDIPLTEKFTHSVIYECNKDYRSFDYNQIIKELTDTIQFYKDNYKNALKENSDLLKTIDQLSQQVTNHSLTRWY